MARTYTKTEALKIADQFGLTLIAERIGNRKVQIHQDWLPDGRQFFKFYASGGKYAGSQVGSAYPA